jgi:heme-degrading monooxygenase HmoA
VEDGCVIVRAWRGRAPAASVATYGRHFRDKVLPELRRIDGFLGASLLEEVRTHDAEDAEILVLTRWTSMDSIRAFAGDNLGRAVVHPDVTAMLSSFDDTVQHYEVMDESG